MTIAEVRLRIKAHFDREDREWMRTAQLAAWVGQMFGSKITAHKLLGIPEPFDVNRFLGHG